MSASNINPFSANDVVNFNVSQDGEKFKVSSEARLKNYSSEKEAQINEIVKKVIEENYAGLGSRISDLIDKDKTCTITFYPATNIILIKDQGGNLVAGKTYEPKLPQVISAAKPILPQVASKSQDLVEKHRELINEYNRVVESYDQMCESLINLKNRQMVEPKNEEELGPSLTHWKKGIASLKDSIEQMRGQLNFLKNEMEKVGPSLTQSPPTPIATLSPSVVIDIQVPSTPTHPIEEQQDTKLDSAAGVKVETPEEKERKEILTKITDPDIKDAELFKILKDRGDLFNPEVPGNLANAFLDSRKVAFPDFYKKEYLADVNARWEANANDKANDPHGLKNEKILAELFANTALISDEELFKFLLNRPNPINHDGGWFKSGTSAGLFATHRCKGDQSPEARRKVFAKAFMAQANGKWHESPQSRATVLSDVILKKGKNEYLLTNEEISEFCKEIGLKPNDPIFLDPMVEKAMNDRGKNVLKDYTAQVGVAQAAKVSTAPSTQIEDPLPNLITLNSHGGFSHEKFTLPDNVYVLAPHPQGFDAPYTLSSPSGTFEEMIYRNKPNEFPTSTAGGWKLYKPGEQVRNVHFSPFSGKKDPTVEYEDWKKRLSVNPKAAKDADGINPKEVAFAEVPARDRNMDPLSYGDKQKKKIKVFGQTDLRKVIAEMQAKHSGEPIVLVPFTCNATGHGDASIHCDPKGYNVQQLFQPPVK